jgi:translation initiation factor IF-2
MAPNSQTERPPIVVVMGHVDHGKSTLLDYIRKSNVVAGEAGGITQHVAAYEVVQQHEGTDKRITFIDTPGHAAFQAIRARGANIADIAILVVAADDGVKAQTLEALAAIRESGIPFVVAINKIDKPNADISRTQASLLQENVFLEKLGGDVPWAAISAKTGAGVPELLNLVLILAEIQEYRGDPSLRASGYVVEAHRDPKRGIAATLIITNGTLKSGMAVTAGCAVSPVRIMEDHTGKSLKEATFSTPITLVGFDAMPEVGVEFASFISKKDAELARKAPVRPNQEASIAADGKFRLPLIVKADAAGSLEAILLEMQKIGDDFTAVQVVHNGIGAVSEADVKAAVASQGEPAAIVAFNVSVEPVAREHARQFSVSIEGFDIIYKLSEYVAETLKKRAPKRDVEEVIGRARILKHFSTKHDTHLVGGSVTEGHLARKGRIRIVRRKEPQGVGTILSIQANRASVDRIDEGREFGVEIDAPCEIREGDIIECFTVTTV